MPENTNTNFSAALMRHTIMDMLNTASTDAPKWHRMNKGFTSIDESPNAQTDTVAYVGDRNTSTETTGYEVSFSFDTRLFVEEEATMKLHYIGTSHEVGAGSTVEYMRVDLFRNLFDPYLDEYEADEYRARKFLCSVAVSTISGDGAAPIVVTGDLNSKGDFVIGKFNINTREFTPFETRVINNATDYALAAA